MCPALDESEPAGQVTSFPPLRSEPSWLRRQLRSESRRLVDSYDPTEALSGSEPSAIAVAAGSLALLFAVLGYTPGVADLVGLRHAWVWSLVSLAGGVTTYVAHKHRCIGPVGTVATLLDNAIYSLALACAATHAEGYWGVGLAAAHGVMTVAMPARVYGPTPSFGLALSLPVAVALLVGTPSPIVVLVLGCNLVCALVVSIVSGSRRRTIRQRAQLDEAMGLSRRAADESMQLALGTTLLSLGNFLHELKNLQTAVRVNLTYLAEQAALDEDARAALEEALATQLAEQALVMRTIGALKRRARPERGRFVLATELEATLGQAKAVPVKLVGAIPDLELSGDAETLRVVLVNLVRNAAEAGASLVRISARLEPGGHAARVLVEDDGPGVPPALRERLFSSQLESSKRNGTGLGLYLCRKHVELLGGSIELVSSARGARFAVVLPVVRPELTPEPPELELSSPELEAEAPASTGAEPGPADPSR